MCICSYVCIFLCVYLASRLSILSLELPKIYITIAPLHVATHIERYLLCDYITIAPLHVATHIKR